MQKRWGKRGDEEIYYVIYAVIMAAIVITSLLSFKGRFERAQVLDELFLSRDLALVMDAAFAAPGALQLTYTGTGLEAFPQLDYGFGGGRVLAGKEQYPYARDLRFAPFRGEPGDTQPRDFGSFSKPRELFLSNSGWRVSLLSEQPAHAAALFRYPLAESGAKQDFAVIWRGELSDAEESALKTFAGTRLVLTGVPDADVLVIVEFVEGNRVEALISPDTAAQSRKLASLIVNRIIISEDIPAAIRLSEDPQLTKGREAAVLLRLPGSALNHAGGVSVVEEEYYHG